MNTTRTVSDWRDGRRSNGNGFDHEYDVPADEVPPASVEEEAPADEPPKGPAWLDREAIVALIRARAAEPWVSLGLGISEITKVRAGGIITLCGGTGAGKTSLANAIAARFAREQGWAVILSLELSADEMGGRMIGMATDAAWSQVLRGELADDRMLEVLPERLVMVEWQGATLDALDAKLSELSADHPGEPTLFVIDYGQLLENPSDEVRAKVSASWELAKRVATRHRSVGLMLSQMSRASSKAARGGERLGIDAIDGGAESAGIERWSSIVLELGMGGQADEHGRREVQLSIAKDRMEGGDRVLPMSYEGRTGRWAVIGDARDAADVRAEAKSRSADSQVATAKLAIQKVAETAPEPLTREELVSKAGIRSTTGRAAVCALLDEGHLVEVRQKKPRSPSWKLWTASKAAAAGVPLAGTAVAS